MVEKKGVIQKVKGRMTDVFFFRLVCQMRPVLNLKPLNNFIYHRPFKMEGMHITNVRSAAETRLDDENQHQRCILCNSNSSTASEISEVSVDRKMLSVYMPPILSEGFSQRP